METSSAREIIVKDDGVWRQQPMSTFCFSSTVAFHRQSRFAFWVALDPATNPGTIDWQFVTSVFKIRKKIRAYYEIFKIRIKKNRFIAFASTCKVFDNTSSRLHWGNRWMGTAQWWSRTAILTQGKTVKLQAIRRLCNIIYTSLFKIMVAEYK